MDSQQQLKGQEQQQQSLFTPPPPPPKICEECGEGGDQSLLRCGKCKRVWYCNLTCQRKHWNVHRFDCSKNELADAVEEQGDKDLATFMRKTQKHAIINDSNVEKPPQWGKIPKPKPLNTPGPPAPVLSFEEQQKQAINSFVVKPGFGVAEKEGTPESVFPYSWTQTQFDVSIIIPLPEGTVCKILSVKIEPSSLLISKVSGDILMQGAFSKPVKAIESSWEFDPTTGILSMTMLKRWRRDNYEQGTTNADTWWKSLFSSSKIIPDHPYPPSDYYSSK